MQFLVSEPAHHEDDGPKPKYAWPKAPIVYDADLYKQRNRIERMFGRLKDWRRIATRYDRCAHAFMSAICIAATVIFWL